MLSSIIQTKRLVSSARIVACFGLAACVGPIDDAENGDDQLATTEQELYGGIRFESNCSSQDRELIEDAMDIGRPAAASNAFAECVETHWANYIPCTGDPHATATASFQLDRIMQVARSINDVRISCPSTGPDSANPPYSYGHGTYESMNLTQSLVNAYAEPTLTGTFLRAYRHIINTIWHEAIHTHGYSHGNSGGGNPAQDRVDCGIPPKLPWEDAVYLVDNCMNEVVRDSADVCGSWSCPDGSRAVVDSYGGSSCECVQDPRLEAPLWSSQFSNASGLTGPDLRSVTFADIDGDGRDDLCGIQGNLVRCFGSTPLGQTPPSFSAWTRSVAGLNVSQSKYRDTLAFPDVNGDGQADACIRQYDGIYCALADMAPPTGSCAVQPCPYFRSPTRWTSAYSDPGGWGAQAYYYDTIQFADLDGDGRDDVCGRGYAGIWCGLSLGNRFSSPSVFSYFFSNANNWHTDPSYWSTIRLVDVSGDGRADVCGRSAYGIYCGHYRRAYRDFGTVRRRESTFADPSWRAPQYYETIEYGDLNGDGTMDVCGRGISGVYCGLYGGLSESVARFSGTGSLDLSRFSDANGWSDRSRYLNMEVVDVDGDGRADVCGRGGEGIECALSTSGLLTSFEPPALWVADFGDVAGWAASPSYYETVQPARVSHANPNGHAFCGRGYGGIHCSRH